jgi:Flp pilus assembly pilin Flp
MLVTSAVSSFVDKLKNEDGQDLIEYALLGGLIAAAIAAAAAAGIMSGALSAMGAGIGRCIDFKASTSCGPFG